MNSSVFLLHNCARCDTISKIHDGGEKMLPKDPAILLSVVNTKLRDFYPTLEALCDDMEVDREYIENTLKSIGYIYNSDRNSFV